MRHRRLEAALAAEGRGLAEAAAEVKIQNVLCGPAAAAPPAPHSRGQSFGFAAVTKRLRWARLRGPWG